MLNKSSRKADVVVIGGGVIGSAIAREITRYDLKCYLLEKNADVAEGTSKANNGIVHAGYAAAYGSLKARLNVQGSIVYETWAKELGVKYRRIGSLVVALTEEEVRNLWRELDNGIKNGVTCLEIVYQERLKQLEPMINPEALAGLYAPTAAIVSPYEFTIALAENAATNGAVVMLETEVLGMEYKNDAWSLFTTKGALQTTIVVNAAGLFSDRLARMAGDDSFTIRPRKGEYYLLDKTLAGLVSHVLFPVPSKVSKGISVTPTLDGNVLVGPTAEPVENREDVSTTRDGLDRVIEGVRKLIPELPVEKTIAQFAGIRATLETEDFLIAKSKTAPAFVNVAGIQSPGLASAPAIAGEVVSVVTALLKDRGHQVRLREDFTPVSRRNPRFRELSHSEQGRLIAQDPDWGEVMCWCEMVTKKEVLDVIRYPLGAKTMDAIKRRTRAGMGRCQRGFCTPRISALLASELGISRTEVTKCGGESKMFAGRVKGFENPRI